MQTTATRNNKRKKKFSAPESADSSTILPSPNYTLVPSPLTPKTQPPPTPASNLSIVGKTQRNFLANPILCLNGTLWTLWPFFFFFFSFCNNEFCNKPPPPHLLSSGCVSPGFGINSAKAESLGQRGHACELLICCCSVPKSCLILCHPHGLKHTRLLCPSLSPRGCSSSCTLG